MNAYILIWADQRRLDEVCEAVRMYGQVEARFPSTPWDVQVTIRDTSQKWVDIAHDLIRKIGGVTSTALAIEVPVERK